MVINKSMTKKIIILFMTFVMLCNVMVPPKAEAFFVIDDVLEAGGAIEAGVGIYVLGALAVGGAAYVFGQSDTADAVWDHATGVWNTTQSYVGDAVKGAIKSAGSLWTSEKDVSKSMTISIPAPVQQTFNANKEKLIGPSLKDFKPFAVDINTYTYDAVDTSDVFVKFSDVGTGSDLGKIVYEISATVNGVFYNMLQVQYGERIILYYSPTHSKTYTYDQPYMYKELRTDNPLWWSHYDQSINRFFGHTGADMLNFVNGAYLQQVLKYFFQLDSFVRVRLNSNGADYSDTIQKFDVAGRIGNLYAKDVFGDMGLKKVGTDYVIKIPPLDQFKAYPKTKAGTPDVTAGPLVFDPTAKQYKDKTGTKVYAPGDIAWSFPKPAIRTDPLTKDKTIGFENTTTGEIEKVTDTPAEGTEEGTKNPPFDYDTPSKYKLSAAVTTRFPFSLPWDVNRVLTVLNAPARTPRINIDQKFMGMRFKIDYSFDYLDPYVPWFRSFIVIGFAMFLIMNTRRLLGGAQ